MNFLKRLFQDIYKATTSSAFLMNMIFATSRGVGILYLSLLSLVLAIVASIFTFFNVLSYIGVEKDFVASQIPAFVIDPSGKLSFALEVDQEKPSIYFDDDKRKYALIKNSSGVPFMLINPQNAKVNDEVLAYMTPHGQTYLFITLFDDKVSINNGLTISSMTYRELGFSGYTITSDTLRNATLKTVQTFGLPFILLVLFVSFWLKALNCMFLAAIGGLIMVRFTGLRMPFKSLCRLASFAVTGPLIVGVLEGIVVGRGNITGYNSLGIWTISGLAIIMMAFAFKRFKQCLANFVQEQISKNGQNEGSCDIFIGLDGKILNEEEVQGLVKKRRVNSNKEVEATNSNQEYLKTKSFDNSAVNASDDRAEQTLARNIQEWDKSKDLTSNLDEHRKDQVLDDSINDSSLEAKTSSLECQNSFTPNRAINVFPLSPEHKKLPFLADCNAYLIA